MAVNGIGVPPPLSPGTDPWRDVIRAQRSGLTGVTADERADPTWAATGNDAWWVTYFQAQYNIGRNNNAGLVGRRNTWNREGASSSGAFRGAPWRTSSTTSTTMLQKVVADSYGKPIWHVVFCLPHPCRQRSAFCLPPSPPTKRRRHYRRRCSTGCWLVGSPWWEVSRKWGSN
jgi:hypothetical protein